MLLSLATYISRFFVILARSFLVEASSKKVRQLPCIRSLLSKLTMSKFLSISFSTIPRIFLLFWQPELKQLDGKHKRQVWQLRQQGISIVVVLSCLGLSIYRLVLSEYPK